MSEYININESDEGDTLVMEDSNDRYVSVSASLFFWKYLRILHPQFDNFFVTAYPWCFSWAKRYRFLPFFCKKYPWNLTSAIWRDFFSVLLQPIFDACLERLHFCFRPLFQILTSAILTRFFFHLQPILDACLERYRWVVSNQSWD